MPRRSPAIVAIWKDLNFKVRDVDTIATIVIESMW